MCFFFLLDALLFIYICRRCILPFQFTYYFWWHRGWSEGDDKKIQQTDESTSNQYVKIFTYSAGSTSISGAVPTCHHHRSWYC